MSRKARYNKPGGFYHVILKGNNGQNIFFNDSDRCRLCLLIQYGVEKYGHRVHAFCLMSNHIHLLVQIGNVSISKIIHNMAFRYSQEFNKRYEKIGHLFQSRFRSILIEESDYFLRLLRYIHLNPVRANLVSSPDEYRWSSHNTYMGANEISWVTLEHAFRKFADTWGNAKNSYYNYVLKCESIEEINELKSDVKNGQVLCSDAYLDDFYKFTEPCKEQKLSIHVIIDAACVVFGIEKEKLLSVGQSRIISNIRGAIVMHALEQGITLEEMAKALNRSASTLSSLMTRFSAKYHLSSDLKNQVEKLRMKSIHLADLQA